MFVAGLIENCLELNIGKLFGSLKHERIWVLFKIRNNQTFDFNWSQRATSVHYRYYDSQIHFALV